MVERPGGFVLKPISQCSGREIMTELLGHLGLVAEAATILGPCAGIPCMMPFIISQFLRRERGARPSVLPKGTQTLAFMGQFCEVPDDVGFTVEYSVRSAQLAVCDLLDLQLKPPGIFKVKFEPRVMLEAFRALHDIAA